MKVSWFTFDHISEFQILNHAEIQNLSLKQLMATMTVMLVTFFVMLVIFSMYVGHQYLNRPQTSQTCLQHIWSPTSK